jgi:hypothetical protein
LEGEKFASSVYEKSGKYLGSNILNYHGWREAHKENTRLLMKLPFYKYILKGSDDGI